MDCKYCGSVRKNNNSLINHERLCKENPNRQILKPKTEAWYESMRKRRGNGSGSGSNQYTKAKRLGLPNPIVSDETKRKIGEKSKLQVWSEERRAAHSIIMRNNVLKYPDSYSKNNVSGRAKLVEYGNTKLKGGWEVKVAVWLDKNNISWTNEIEPIKYSWEGKDKLYFPDFYLPEYDLYIEVKGYKRDIDEAKWNSVEKQLLIVDKSTIHKIDTLDIDFLKKYHSWK